MQEHEKLFANIRRFVQIEQEDALKIAAIARVVQIRKRQFIDQPGYVCRFRNYVVKGAFRSFYVSKDGKEHTVQIAIDDWFVSDFYSYITQTPATLFVEALENSVIIQMHYDDIESLCRQIHSLSEYFRITTERAFAFSRKRALGNLSKTAEERYLDILERYPDIVNRVPQKVIASYLGMTPEFMSKIRKKLAGKS